MDPMLMQMLMQLLGQQQGMGQMPGWGGGMPLVPGFTPTPQYGFPGMGGGILPMLLQGFLPQLVGPNFISGPFAGGQNLYDFRSAMEYQAARQRGMAASIESNANTYIRLIQGLGIPLDTGQQEAVRAFARGPGAGIAPFVSQMFPTTWDQLHGFRGDAYGMTGGVMDAARYMFDPVTGRYGMGGTQAAGLSTDLFNRLYGPGADLRAMRGIGGTVAGQMLDEMVRRGLGPAQMITREEGLDAVRREYGIAYGGITESTFLPSGVTDTAIRGVATGRAMRAAQNMAPAVKAMQEIFAGEGRNEVSMPEIFNALDAISAGGLGTMTPQDMERHVRTMKNLAEMTGIGIAGMQQVISMSVAAAQQAGMSPQMARGMTAFTMATVGAWNAVGQPTTFGAMQQGELPQILAMSQAGAAASEQARRIGVFMMLSEQLVRQEGGKAVTGFKAGGEAARWAALIRAGKTTDPTTGQSIFDLGERGIRRILADEDMSAEAIAMNMQLPTKVVEAQIAKYGLAQLIAPEQLERDIIPALRQAVEGRIETKLAADMPAIPEAQREGLAVSITTEMTAAAIELKRTNPEAFDNPATRHAEMAKIARLRLQNAGVDISRFTDADLQNMARETFMGYDAALAESDRFKAIGSFERGLQAYDPRVRAARDAILQQQSAINRLQAATAGLAAGGVISRVSEGLQRAAAAGRPMQVQDVVSAIAGGVERQDMVRPIAEMTMDLLRLQDEYQKLVGRTDPASIKQQEMIEENIKRLTGDINVSMGGGNQPLSQLGIAAQQRAAAQEPVVGTTAGAAAWVGAAAARTAPAARAAPGGGAGTAPGNISMSSPAVTITANSVTVGMSGGATDDSVAGAIGGAAAAVIQERENERKKRNEPIAVSGTLTVIGPNTADLNGQVNNDPRTPAPGGK